MNIYRSNFGDFGNFGDVPPCGNVDSANDVGITSKTARKAFELQFQSMTKLPTFRTGLGCIGRVDHLQANASFSTLVLEEGSQLVERPASEHSAGSSALLMESLPDAFQFFQTDKLVIGFCRGNHGFTDDVINVSLKPVFPAAKPFQGSLAAFRAFLLQGCFGSSVTLTNAVEFAAREHLACGEGCDALNSKIYAQRLRTFSNRLRNVDIDVCKEMACSLILINGASAKPKTPQELTLILSDGELYANAPCASGQGSFFFGLDVTKQFVIEGKTGWLETYGILLCCNTVKDANAIISLEPVLCSHVMVEVSGEREAVEHLKFVAVYGNFIAGLGKPNHRFRDSKSLIFGDYQFAFDGLNHNYILTDRKVNL